MRALEAALTVRDLAASTAWYTDALGFAVERTHERDGVAFGVSLAAGGVRILLTQDDGARGADRAKGEGVSFQLTTDDDIDALAERVRAAGTPLDTEPVSTPWGTRAFRVRDPDGFRFAVSSPRPTAADR